MAATVAATFLRDAARAALHEPDHAAELANQWSEQRVALIHLIAPADYEVLSQAVGSTSLDETGLVETLDDLVALFWREHQAFILTPLVKYMRRDDLSDKVNVIIRRAQ